MNGGYDFCDKTVMLDADIVLNETDGWENWDIKHRMVERVDADRYL